MAWEEYWSGGVVEYWNDGKNQYSGTPVLQYSGIPLLHHSETPRIPAVSSVFRDLEERAMKRTILPLIVAMLAVGPVVAQGTAGKATDVELTIYNQSFALVKEQREMSLAQGVNNIAVKDVAAMIEATSVAFKSLTDPSAVVVREQNYRYDLISPETILNKSIGKQVKVRRIIDGKVVEEQGVLLSSGQSGRVIRTATGVIINPYGEIEVTELPEGLVSTPTLVWKLEASKAGTHNTQVAYLTNGISWMADYVAVVDPLSERFGDRVHVGDRVIELVHRRAGRVYVAVDQPRQHHLAAEVYHDRARVLHAQDFAVAAGRRDAPILHGDGFRDGELLVYGYYPAVMEYQIGCRESHCGEQQHRDTQHPIHCNYDAMTSAAQPGMPRLRFFGWLVGTTSGSLCRADSAYRRPSYKGRFLRRRAASARPVVISAQVPGSGTESASQT